MKRTLIAAAFAAALPAFSAAHEYKVDNLEVVHPVAFETAPSVRAGGGYLEIINDGTEADTLIGVTADFPKVMLHQSVEKDGVATMRHVDRLEIPAGKTVKLEPGGYHVMFMGLTEPLEVGAKFPATLIFEKAGPVEIIFQVEARGEDTGEHSH
ncbi:copper chaperone PCu(A)C [Roseovarius aestuarii]|nr:copper chaperone PCu(A)C [Roseovarius aestuarii]